MLDKQKEYVDFLQKLKNYLGEIETINEEEFKLNEKILEINNLELLIPVIGAFSAGKSTLLNSFLGKKYLNVAVTPETALATELRYSTSEYIEAVTNDERIVKFAIEDGEIIKSRSSEFKYIRYYINSDILKSIEPLILVDMPGFESPVDLHNRAILEYVERGVYFVALQSVEDGNITKSMIRNLQSIEAFGRKFSFFLSKVNLKPESEVAQIEELVREQLSDYFKNQSDITRIGNNGGESLNSIINEINPNEIVEELCKPQLKDLFTDIKQTINTSITSLSKDKEANDEAIKDLNGGLEKLEQEKNDMIREVERRYGNKNVNSIVEDVGRALSNSAYELAQSYKSSGQSGLGVTINEIVKNTLSSSIQTTMTNISQDIVSSFTLQLESIDNTMSKITLSDDAIKSIGDNVTQLGGVLTNFLSTTAGKVASTGVSSILGGVLSFTVPVVGPIVGILVALLPTLLGGLFGGQQNKEQEKQNEMEQIKNAILTQVIPQVKSEVRVKIPSILNEQIQNMIKSIGESFKEKIDQKKSAIEASQKEIEAKKLNIEETIAKYKRIVEEMTALASSVLYN